MAPREPITDPVFNAVTATVNKLTNKHGVVEVQEILREWVAFIDKVRNINERNGQAG